MTHPHGENKNKRVEGLTRRKNWGKNGGTPREKRDVVGL